ncbi:MAG: D-alanine--D-alanine ligase [Pirellulales bacterium]|nr:D-alanine--D-alanine ligase [Pirellulales bacterium]
MHIGLTYDLRSEYLAAGYGEEETAEFDRPDTIDAIEEALAQLGHRPDRVGHARQLVERLAYGDRWDLVFNIAEGLHGTAREAQIPALLDVFEIPYTFSDPLVLAVGLDKGLSKLIVREAGLCTPDFAVVRSAGDLRTIDLSFPLFIKPLAEGTGKGITSASKINRPQQLQRVCGELLPRFPGGLLLETYLPGREFTVGLLGSGEQARVLGTLEIVLREQAEPGAYSYLNKEQCEELVEYRFLPSSEDGEVRVAEELALCAWRALGCRDAGRVDIRCDASGCPSFIEVNPLAGLHPQHSDLPMLCTALGMSYVELIDAIVASATAGQAAQNGFDPSESKVSYACANNS